jgi:hypothetical protein
MNYFLLEAIMRKKTKPQLKTYVIIGELFPPQIYPREENKSPRKHLLGCPKELFPP